MKTTTAIAATKTKDHKRIRAYFEVRMKKKS